MFEIIYRNLYRKRKCATKFRFKNLCFSFDLVKFKDEVALVITYFSVEVKIHSFLVIGS